MNLQDLQKVRDELQGFTDFFRTELGRSERRHWCYMYLCGLMLDGERKSIQPIANRLPGGNEQALQQFVNQSPWDHLLVETKLAKYLVEKFNAKRGALILDDTSLPKKGNKSVGVSHQYCGALGKVSNCQSIVTWHYSEFGGEHFPITAELFLPEKWTSNSKRMEEAKVPKRRHRYQKKWQLALNLLDKTSQEALPYEVLLFDAGYGEVREFLKELDERELTFVAQIPETHSFWSSDVPTKFTNKKKGRPRLYPVVEDPTSKPRSAKRWKEHILEKEIPWETVPLALKSKQETKICAIRVKEVITQHFYRPGVERWLVIERVCRDEYKYYISNAPLDTSPEKIASWIHERWKIEQGYQQMKEELGMDHFEGRSWRGLHHHIVLCFMAYAFLLLLKSKEAEKKSTLHYPELEEHSIISSG